MIHLKNNSLPARLIEQGHRQRRQVEIVREEAQAAVLFDIVVTDPAQSVGVMLGGSLRRENHRVIRDHSGAKVGRTRVAPPQLHSFFDAPDKERAGSLEEVQPLEIHISPIHHIEGAGLGHEAIEDVDVVDFSWGNLDKCGDGAAHIEQSVHLHRRLAGSKTRPREHGQAKVDGGGIEGVEGTVEIETQRFVGVQRTSDSDQRLCEVGVDAPVVRVVGVRQGRARDFAAKSGVVEFGPDRTQADFNIAQTFDDRLVARRPGRETVPTGERCANDDRREARDALAKFIGGEMIHQLCEDGAAGVHAPLWGASHAKTTCACSNR